ncbi:MAG: ABC transporter permease [Candidatus Acidiferrales bacterium]
MGMLLQDLRYAVRMFGKSRGFTAVAVLTLALGIGANTAIFSLIDTVLLRPLPYANPGQLVDISTSVPEKGLKGIVVSWVKFQHLQELTKTLESVGAFYSTGFNMVGQGEPEQIDGIRVTGDLFHVLGISPAHGRGFLPEEDQIGGAEVAMLSDAFWHSHFNGDPAVIGRSISLDGKSTTIVGILPATFRFPFQQPEPAVWVPRVFDILGLRPDQLRMGAGFLSVIARLKPGETIAHAQAEANAINQSYTQAFPGNADSGTHTLIITSLENNLVGSVRPSLIVLLVAVGFVLLIACANVASLLLARATAREKEVAIRQALGASRGRLARQLLTESVLLSFVGGTLGVIVAAWSLPLLRFAAPGTVPRLNEVRVDGIVLMFSLGLCILTGVAFGLFPALQVSRRDLHETLKEGGRGSSESGRGGRARRLMVIAEVAVALMLVTGAGLLIKSFVNLLHVNPGFDARGVTTFPLNLPTTRYATGPQRVEFFRQALERVREVPNIDSAGMVTYLPLAGPIRYVFFCAEGQVCQGIGKDPLIALRQASPGFFETMRIPLLRGRTFTERDIPGAPPVVIVNQTVADRYFPHQDPIGKTIQNSRDMIPMQIVGVVADVKFNSLSTPKFEEMYLPYQQSPWMNMTLVVRSNSALQPLASAVREKIAQLDPDLPMTGIQPMEKIVSVSVGQPRLITGLVGAFAGFALLLAAVGIYGVMAYSVSQRSHEMGIRMALGAAPRDIFRLVVGQGMRLVLAGIALGFLASLGLTRLMATLLFGTSANDPVTFAAVAFILVGVALAACYIPARRATRVDPLVALRYE